MDLFGLLGLLGFLGGWTTFYSYYNIYTIFVYLCILLSPILFLCLRGFESHARSHYCLTAWSLTNCEASLTNCEASLTILTLAELNAVQADMTPSSKPPSRPVTGHNPVTFFKLWVIRVLFHCPYCPNNPNSPNNSDNSYNPNNPNNLNNPNNPNNYNNPNVQ